VWYPLEALHALVGHGSLELYALDAHHAGSRIQLDERIGLLYDFPFVKFPVIKKYDVSPRRTAKCQHACNKHQNVSH
jgi:hypothetical protein